MKLLGLDVTLQKLAKVSLVWPHLKYLSFITWHVVADSLKFTSLHKISIEVEIVSLNVLELPYKYLTNAPKN